MQLIIRKDKVREESEDKVSLTSVLYHHAHVIDQVTFGIIDVTVFLFSIVVTWLIRGYKKKSLCLLTVPHYVKINFANDF